MNKTLDYYLSLTYKLVVVDDKDGYTAYYPDLPGCMTCGETPDEVFANALDAKKCWFEACLKDGIDIPEPSDVLSYQVG